MMILSRLVVNGIRLQNSSTCYLRRKHTKIVIYTDDMHISSSLLIPVVSGIYLLSVHLILRVCQLDRVQKVLSLFGKVVAD